MPRKKKVTPGPERPPYSGSLSEIVAYPEMPFNKDVIKEGDKIKIKNTRGEFVFLRFVHNITLDRQWVDCWDRDGRCRSFYVDKIASVVRPKRSRAKSVKQRD